MRRISAFFISLLLLHIQAGTLRGQDSLLVPLKINAGLEISGPVIYMANKKTLNAQGFLALDRNEKMSYVIEGGFSRFQYSQYNYDFLSNGIFLRAGVDFNLLEPEVSRGRYRAGIGLRYGTSFYTMETPSFSHEDYWGTITSSISPVNRMGHFLEFVPGVKTELFNNLTIGWSIRLRLLISAGTGQELRPVYMPGFGNAGKTGAAGFSYYLIFQIPYKSKMVIIKPEVIEEEMIDD